MFERIEPGSTEGDMIAFYESFFRGVLLVDQRRKIADLRLVDPIFPEYSHYRFLVTHLKGLGFTVMEREKIPDAR